MPVKPTVPMKIVMPWESKRMYLSLLMIVGIWLGHYFPVVKEWFMEEKMLSALTMLGAFLQMVTKDKIVLR